MKIEKGGGGGIQYRSVTGLPWTRPQPAGQPPYDLKFMMTSPQADFWYPVSAQTASYTGQWYSETAMQGILAYRGQVTQALPGQTNRPVATIGDKQALGGYVKVNEWNDYKIIARGSVMMHIMNGQLMAVFIDDNKDSVITNHVRHKKHPGWRPYVCTHCPPALLSQVDGQAVAGPPV